MQNESAHCPAASDFRTSFRCALPEWLVLSPHGNTDFHARAVFSLLRAHAAMKSKIQVGLKTDIPQPIHNPPRSVQAAGADPSPVRPTGLAIWLSLVRQVG